MKTSKSDSAEKKYTVSAGVDYNAGAVGIYEFVIDDGEKVIHRKSWFKSKKAALKAAFEFQSELESVPNR
jgi:hypothetical protein